MLHLNCTPTIRSVREALLGDDIDDEHAESLDAFALRFRPNLRIDDPETGRYERAVEDAAEIRIGPEVVLRVNEPTIRCPSTRVRYDVPRGERAAEEWNLTWGCDLRFQNCAPAFSGGTQSSSRRARTSDCTPA